MKKEFTYVSAFAGIGGMTLGLKDLGGKGLMAWEYDPTEKRRQYAQEAHKLLHPEIPVHGDICEVDTNELPDFDVLCFTPPCQAFSVAGKRGGFDDTRGTLTFEALRIANVKRPKILFMENVKGLVNHDKGNTMSTIIHAINEIGYTVDYNVINSKYFDVAQNRERVYLVAVRNDLITPEPWSDTKGNTMLPKSKRRYQEEGAITFNFDWPEQTEVRTRLRDFLETNIDDRYYLSEDKTEALIAQLEAVNYVNDGRVEEFSEGDGVSCCIDASYAKGKSPGDVGKGRRTHIIEESPIMLGHIDLKGHDAIKRVYSTDGQGPTLTTMGGGHREPKIATTDGPRYRIRKLTPKECLRLQSVPDWAIDILLESFSDSRVYKFAGNGLTTNVIKAIGEKLLKYL